MTRLPVYVPFLNGDRNRDEGCCHGSIGWTLLWKFKKTKYKKKHVRAGFFKRRFHFPVKLAAVSLQVFWIIESTQATGIVSLHIGQCRSSLHSLWRRVSLNGRRR